MKGVDGQEKRARSRFASQVENDHGHDYIYGFSPWVRWDGELWSRLWPQGYRICSRHRISNRQRIKSCGQYYGENSEGLKTVWFWVTAKRIISTGMTGRHGIYRKKSYIPVNLETWKKIHKRARKRRWSPSSKIITRETEGLLCGPVAKTPSVP